VDFKGNPLKLKLYPPLKNVVKGVFLVRGGSILEYKAKVDALSKPRSSCPSTTLTLQPIQKSEHKCKKEKSLPLGIRDKVQEDFILVCKKCLTKHGGQIVKQVSKPQKILEHIVSLDSIIHEKNRNTMVLDHTFFI
jgi:hypothetical protein